MKEFLTSDFALVCWVLIYILFKYPFFYFSYSCSKSKKSIE